MASNLQHFYTQPEKSGKKSHIEKTLSTKSFYEFSLMKSDSVFASNAVHVYM